MVGDPLRVVQSGRDALASFIVLSLLRLGVGYPTMRHESSRLRNTVLIYSIKP